MSASTHEEKDATNMESDMYQARYIAYARAHGRTPVEQEHYDKLATPAGCMTNYILWINEQIVKFREVCPSAFTGTHLSDHDAFTSFVGGITSSD